MKTYPCNRGLRSRYDIVAFSPPVYTETMKTIMKTKPNWINLETQGYENGTI